MYKHSLFFLIFLLGLFFGQKGFTQGLTASPYSQFGMGELNQSGFFLNQSLGGAVGYASDFSINHLNPASYPYLLRTAGEFGLRNNASFFKTGIQQSFQNNVSFYNLSLAFPVTKRWSMSLGILPYSAKGYKLSYYSPEPNIGLVNRKYQGSGSISKVFLGNGVKLISLKSDSISLAVGANASFLFGLNKNNSFVQFNASNKYYSLQYVKEDYYKGFNADGGLMFKWKKKKYSASFGAAYTLGNEVFHSQTEVAATYFISSSGTYQPKDEVYSRFDTLRAVLPSSLGVGIAWEVNKSDPNAKTRAIEACAFLADIRQTRYSSDYTEKTASTIYQYSAGFQFDGRKMANPGFFKNTVYRLSLSYAPFPVKIENTTLHHLKSSLGFSFPVPGKRMYNRFNAGISAGQLGNKDNGLIRQRYLLIDFGITFGDVWFERSKID